MPTELQKSIATGLSMPRAIKERIDKDRGDISRSKFILRLLEKIYPNELENRGTGSDITSVQLQNHTPFEGQMNDKSRANEYTRRRNYKKNKVALRLVGKPSSNANNRVSSISTGGPKKDDYYG